MKSSFVCMWLENSTAHGLSHAARSRSFALRLIWVFFFLGATAAFLYYFIENYEKYSSEPTSMTMKLYGTKFIPPDVHICNTYPLANSRLVDPLNLNTSAVVDLQVKLKKIEDLLATTNLTVDQKVSFFWTSLSHSKLFSSLSHLKNQTLLSMRFATGRQIPKNEIETLPNINHFSCFRLSLSNQREFQGTSDQLFLFLYIDSYQVNKTPLSFVNTSFAKLDYLLTPSEFGGGGMTLIFTPPGKYPQIESHSVLIGPGVQTSIKLQMQKNVVVNTRKSPCQTNLQSVVYSNPLFEFETTNRFQRALANCRYRKVMEKMILNDPSCKCIPFMVPTTLDMLQGFPICANVSKMNNTTKSTDISAIINQINCSFKYYEYDTLFQVSECNNEKPCETITYSSDTSTIDWPIENQLDDILKFQLVPLFNGLGDAPGIRDYLKMIDSDPAVQFDVFKHNFALVKLSAAEMNSRLTEEFVSYGIENLISDGGGLAGLYLGMSFLTILEVMDLIHHFIYNALLRRSAKKNAESPNLS